MPRDEYYNGDEFDISKFPDLQNRDYFLMPNGKCACRLSNGTVVELPTNGVTNPAEWNPSTRSYVSNSLQALAGEEVEFTVMPEYTDGRVKFTISSERTRFGWGARGFTESGEPKFTLYGNYH